MRIVAKVKMWFGKHFHKKAKTGPSGLTADQAQKATVDNLTIQRDALLASGHTAEAGVMTATISALTGTPAVHGEDIVSCIQEEK